MCAMRIPSVCVGWAVGRVRGSLGLLMPCNAPQTRVSPGTGISRCKVDWTLSSH